MQDQPQGTRGEAYTGTLLYWLGNLPDNLELFQNKKWFAFFKKKEEATIFSLPPQIFPLISRETQVSERTEHYPYK